VTLREVGSTVQQRVPRLSILLIHIREFCYAGTMIELNQSAQCLFCPQRRKIALLFKLALAGGAAVITGLILFLPRANPAQVKRSALSPSLSSRASLQASTELASIDISATPEDAISIRSQELRRQAQERFLAVQAQLRSLLGDKPQELTEAQKLIDSRRKEVLMAKLLLLGDPLFIGSSRAEAHRKLVQDAMEKELDALHEQSKLLSQLKDPK
jgi:hypothetical protein